MSERVIAILIVAVPTVIIAVTLLGSWWLHRKDLP